VAIVTERAMADLRMPLRGARVAVQGFGNVGSWAAHHLAALGAKVVAVSDVNGAVHAGDGLDVARLREVVVSDGTVVGASGVEALSNDELLALDVDVLVPAALEGALHSGNAADVRARLIVEGANAPVTPVADQHFDERGITVVPDILANAGGVTVSYFEWAQNTQRMRWTAEDVDMRLGDILRSAYTDVRGHSVEHNVSLRTAAFMLAVRRVASASALRGTVAGPR